MDILDSTEVQTGPVDLGDLIESNTLASAPAPLASQRNIASTTSLLSDPNTAMDNYGNMVNELGRGEKNTLSILDSQIQNRARQGDLAAMMNILADKSVPFATKQELVKNMNNAPLLQDKTTLLHTSLLQAPSKDETPDGEKARISSADAIAEVMQSRAQIQGIVNGLRQDHEGSSLFSQFLNHASGLIPFADTVVTDKVIRELSQQSGIDYKWWQSFVTELRPGTAKRKMQEQISSLPPEQRVKFAQMVADTVRNKSGLIFGTDNQYRAYELADQLLSPDSYGRGGELIDNSVVLLDALGAKGIMDGTEAAVKYLRNGLPKGTKPSPVTMGQPGTNQATTQEFSQVQQVQGEAPEGLKTPVQQPKNVGALLGGKAPTEPPTKDVGALLKNAPAEEPPVNPGAALLRTTGVKQPEATKSAGALLTPKPVKKENLADVMQRIRQSQAVRDVNPATPGEVAQQSNPDAARGFYVAAEANDEIAHAIYGVDSAQAVSNQTLPQLTTSVEGAVDSRVGDIEKQLRMTDPVRAALADTSVSGFTSFERAGAEANVVNDFSNPVGLTINDAMSSFSVNGSRASVSAVYEVPGGSFSNAQEAFDQAKFALRKYGIADEDITLLTKDGITHVPVDKGNLSALPEGDYKIRVSLDWELGSGDLDEYSKLSVKRNWFDRFATTSGDQGSLNRHMFDAASTLDPTITTAASVTKDYAARLDKILLQNAGSFADTVGAMKKARQEKIYDYLREANHNGIGFDQVDLVARGFNQSEINAISKWRTFWDDHFFLENLDVVRTLRGNGFMKFENANTKLYAKPAPKNQNIGAFYDPASDTVRYFVQGELDDLYNKGGTIAKLRRPTTFGSDTTEYMIVRNNPTEYLQGLRDSEQVLNYRKGYFQVQYNAPKYIDEVKVDSSGREIGRRAVAVAEDKAQGDLIARRMANQTGERYVVRNESKGGRRGGDDAWDINSSGGRISQRHRGKLLEGASAPNTIGEEYVVNPAESAIRASRSIAQRTVQRQFLENATERMLKQYEAVMPKDEFGRARFPRSASEIGAKGESNSKMVADARTTWEYLNYIRNGYINSMDNASKALFNAIAETAGERGFSKVERLSRKAGEANPSGALKGTVFNAYIASNPLRQWIVQTAQVYRTMVYNPIGWATGAVNLRSTEYINHVWFGGKATEFTEFVRKSGLLEAVDYHNLIDDQLKVMADQSNILRYPQKGLKVLRQVGFDTAETSNMMMHAAAVFDRYKRLGKDLSTKEGREAAYGEIRALSYEMNAAGDMPYNRTSAAAVLQFLQMPHKALLNYTNRKLEPAMRTRLAVGDALLYGAPTAALMSAVLGEDSVPQDPLARKVMDDGLISMFYNKILSNLWEGTHDANFDSLRPVDLEGWAKMAKGLWTDGLSGAVANSPAYGLLAKEGGRVPQAIQSMAMFFGIRDDFDKNDPVTFVGMLDDIAKISSGYNNAHKAYLASTMGERRDSYGKLIDKDTTTGDTIATLFGFGSKEAADRFVLEQKLSGDIKSHKDDVISVYKSIKRYYADRLANEENPDLARMTGVTSAAMSYYRNDPEAMKIIRDQIMLDFNGRSDENTRLMQLILKAAGLPGSNNMELELNKSSFNDQDKQKVRDAIRYTKQGLSDLEQYNKGKE